MTTDGRTSFKNLRSNCWSVTAYDDNLKKMEDNKNYPPWVTKVVGGVEICPDTKRRHFQGALFCKDTIRAAQVLKWLINCHIEVAKSKDALANYCMKKDTSEGVKQVLTNQTTDVYYKQKDVLLAMGTWVLSNPKTMEKWDEKYNGFSPEFKEYYCSLIFGRLMAKDYSLIQLYDASLKLKWKDLYHAIINQAMKTPIVLQEFSDTPKANPIDEPQIDDDPYIDSHSEDEDLTAKYNNSLL